MIRWLLFHLFIKEELSWVIFYSSYMRFADGEGVKYIVEAIVFYLRKLKSKGYINNFFVCTPESATRYDLYGTIFIDKRKLNFNVFNGNINWIV